MNNAREKFLLYFLYGLAQLNTPLSPDEKKGLKKVAEQLKDDRKGTAWEKHTKSKLTEIINNNSSLKTIFDDINSKPDRTDKILENLTIDRQNRPEVNQTTNQLKERPIPNDKKDDNSSEIINSCIDACSSEDPPKAAKEMVKKDEKK